MIAWREENESPSTHQHDLLCLFYVLRIQYKHIHTTGRQASEIIPAVPKVTVSPRPLELILQNMCNYPSSQVKNNQTHPDILGQLQGNLRLRIEGIGIGRFEFSKRWYDLIGHCDFEHIINRDFPFKTNI